MSKSPSGIRSERILHDRLVYLLAVASIVADVILAPTLSSPLRHPAVSVVVTVCLVLTQFVVVQVPRRNGRKEPVPTSSLWLIMLVLITPLGYAQAAVLIARAIFHRVHKESWKEWIRSTARMVVVTSITGIFFALASRVHDRFDTDYLDTNGLLLCLLTSYLFMALMVTSNVLDLSYRDGTDWRAVLAEEKELRLRMYIVFATTAPMLVLLSTKAVWVALLGLMVVYNAASTARRMVHFSQRAVTDQLTKIGNRAAFTAEIEEVLAGTGGKNSVALLMLDIDRFKQINDTLGHPVGDVVVQQIAYRLSTELPAGARPFRLGGDEFVVLVSAVRSEDQVGKLAQQILEMVARPVFFSDADHPKMEASRLVVSTSIGVAIYPQHGTDGTELLKNADRAMYEAKEDSNAFCIYTEALRTEGIDDLELMADLHEAVTNSAFEVHYQPKVCARNGQTRGVESLVRWKHPIHGYISPDVFIPMAERAGLILPLTNIVARDLLVALDVVHAQGHDLVFSLNISASMLSSLAIEDWFDQVKNTPNLPLEYVTLEVTESAMNINSRSHRMVQRLRDLGMRLSIDDYGTGYSSLSRMADLYPDELKIDKSFVWKLNDPRTRAIVASTISMCEALGIHTVAEGVETKEQSVMLQQMGCDIFQGYLYARPMTLAQLLPWLDEQAELTGGRGGISKEAEEYTRRTGLIENYMYGRL